MRTTSGFPGLITQPFFYFVTQPFRVEGIKAKAVSYGFYCSIIQSNRYLVTQPFRVEGIKAKALSYELGAMIPKALIWV